MSNVTTVTHPDGTVAKRTSKSRVYTHAVVVDPAQPEARRRALVRQAELLDQHAERLEAAAEHGEVQIKVRDLGYANPTGFHSHEAILLGTEKTSTHRRREVTYHEISSRADENGLTEEYTGQGLDKIVRPVREVLIDQARTRAAAERESAYLLREQADEPDTSGYAVVRWSSSRDLATKALAEFEYETDRYGRRVHVVEVD